MHARLLGAIVRGALVTVASLVVADALLVAHGRDARYVEDVRWTKAHITRTFAASRSELLAGTKRSR